MATEASRAPMGSRPDYLMVDDFLRDVVGARALQSALEFGLIDELLRRDSLDMHAASACCGIEPKAARLLVGLLCGNGVFASRDDRFELTAGFRHALRFRDLIEAKLDFASLVAPDFLFRFSTLLADPERFFAEARLFDLFSYDRCFDPTPENVARTRRWMSFTTTLTRYEAQACLDRFDFSRSERLLDVGGNSGEFALRLCRSHARLLATVLDLPVVCMIGREHVAAEPEAERIGFLATADRGEAFPEGFDTICFKSMLHDWPDAEMHAFLERAHAALDPGGRVLIFERGMLEPGSQPLPYSLVPIMLFFRSYRSAADYREPLGHIGFRDIRIQTVALDVPFLLIEASK